VGAAGWAGERVSVAEAWSPALALGVTAVVLLALPWGLKLGLAPAVGEPCGGGFDCAALRGRCVVGEHGRFCTVTCAQDSDCPSSGHCGIPPHDRWQRWFSTSELSERVCVPGPRPEQPLAVDGAMPEPRNEATSR